MDKFTSAVSLAFKAIFLLSRLYGYAEYYFHVSSVNDFNVIWRVSTNAWSLLLALSIACALIQRMICGRRIARENTQLINRRGARPVPDSMDHGSVMGLSWSMDYGASVRMHLTRTFLRPGTWASVAFVGAFMALLMACDYTQGAIIEPDGMICFIVGSVLGILFRVVIVSDEQRRLFPTKDSVREQALIVETDGIRWFEGDQQASFCWPDIQGISSAVGIVSFYGGGLLHLVPPFAFQSAKDAKAFAPVLRAMKRGQSSVVYNWSAYHGRTASVDGVWPPPIV